MCIVTYCVLIKIIIIYQSLVILLCVGTLIVEVVHVFMFGALYIVILSTELYYHHNVIVVSLRLNVYDVYIFFALCA